MAGENMKVYQFPLKPESKKSNMKADPTKSLNSKDSNFDDQADFEDIFEEIDISKVNRLLFLRYAKLFPSFKPFQKLIKQGKIETLHHYYCEEEIFSEAQELIFEFLIELLSPYDCGFMIKEIYLLLPKEDRCALIKILDHFNHIV